MVQEQTSVPTAIGRVFSAWREGLQMARTVIVAMRQFGSDRGYSGHVFNIVDPTLVTHFYHRRPVFAVMHNTAFVQRCGRVWPSTERGKPMRRREVITLLGGAAAWPLAARAQQAATPVIGFLGLGPPRPKSPLVAALLEGVAEAGYVEGRNVAIEFRWANFTHPLLPRLASELVDRRVAVIVTQGSPYAVLARRARDVHNNIREEDAWLQLGIQMQVRGRN
jgi:hypothetical protein